MKKQRVSKDIKAILELSVKKDLVLEHRLNEFLLTWDGNYSPDAVKKIHRALSAKQRDRRFSWSASSAGKPLRHQELSFLGAPTVGSTDPRLQMIFHNGTWTHMRYQAILLTAGLLDNIEVTIKRPSERARCTMDGMGTVLGGRYDGREFGFELKSRNDFQFKRQVVLDPDDRTRAQVDFEFWLSGLDMFVILNENKNTQEPKEWVFFREEDRVRDIRNMVKELNKAIDQQRLHPIPEECKESNFKSCPWGPNGACANTGSWYYAK